MENKAMISPRIGCPRQDIGHEVVPLRLRAKERRAAAPSTQQPFHGPSVGRALGASCCFTFTGSLLILMANKCKENPHSISYFKQVPKSRQA